MSNYLNSSSSKTQTTSNVIVSQIFPTTQNESTHGTPTNLSSPPSKTPNTPYSSYPRPSGTSIFQNSLGASGLNMSGSGIPTNSIGGGQQSFAFNTSAISQPKQTPLTTSNLNTNQPIYFSQQQHSMHSGMGFLPQQTGNNPLTKIPLNSLYDLDIQKQQQYQEQQQQQQQERDKLYLSQQKQHIVELNQQQQQYLQLQQSQMQQQQIQQIQQPGQFQPSNNTIIQQIQQPNTQFQQSAFVPFQTQSPQMMNNQLQQQMQQSSMNQQQQQPNFDSSLQSSQFNQYLGVNQDSLDSLDKRWVKVYGYQQHDLSLVLDELSRYGNILDREFPSKDFNFLYLKYEYEYSTFDLLKKSGNFSIGNSIIGFTLCPDKLKNDSDPQAKLQTHSFSSIQEKYVPSRIEYDPNSTNQYSTPSRPSFLAKFSEYVLGL
ncbi:hypothetical protein DLAC_09638 [Tieghemostelium lacteum]|uniref:RRM Nup35-type domain-containing protein n=1 Tax=Tieghemostelium lacteum TaxID=361077 RepID=A0A151Z6T7_TIELA|nr:hypothetical protein DLAC_09638 [Tieghemostelium lacteum]|eukprot:KYQ89672.1 hypothetical protein DLAC_09638 [Tieghemostelium lacteum]